MAGFKENADLFMNMLPAITLVHKGAMPIARHAVSTFARHFTGTHHLRIHSDGSLDVGDEEALLRAAGNMPTVMVHPADRQPLLDKRLSSTPRTRALLTGGAYFTKLQLPVVEKAPYFYFDSDIVWLRHVPDLTPPSGGNAFSTESWTWYHGVANDGEWIRERIPRRVNSGFYYVSQEFPFARMESMLERGLFHPFEWPC